MDQLTWLWIGTVAAILSGAGITSRVDPDKRTLLAFIAMLVWAAWGFLAGDLRIYGDAVVYSASYSLARYLGWLFGLVMFVYFLQGALGRLNPADEETASGPPSPGD